MHRVAIDEINEETSLCIANDVNTFQSDVYDVNGRSTLMLPCRCDPAYSVHSPCTCRGLRTVVARLDSCRLELKIGVHLSQPHWALSFEFHGLDINSVIYLFFIHSFAIVFVVSLVSNTS